MAKVTKNCAYCGKKFERYAPRIWRSDSYWKQPLRWDRDAERAGIRKRVFCGSLCDVMEDREDLNPSRARLYNLICDTPNLDWMLLTKRPQNFKRFLPKTWLIHPRANVWGMTTVEANAYRWRIDALAETPFVVRGLSCEPLLEDLRIEQQLQTGLIQWVIAGGESGRGARTMCPEWVTLLRDQCIRTRVAFHFKQWGNWCDTDQMPEDVYREMDANGHLPGLYNIGKKAAGRMLDGREWNELPTVTEAR